VPDTERAVDPGILSPVAAGLVTALIGWNLTNQWNLGIRLSPHLVLDRPTMAY
jgi:hypothetical protein